jgi:antitoxin component of MazEF toxin-antitoxin module
MALVKKLTKIGNSTGIILPSDILKVAGLSDDAEVQISVKENQIILEPANLKDRKVMKTFLSVIEDFDATLKKLAK